MAAAAEPRLGHAKRAAARTEHVIERNTHAVITDVAVAAFTLRFTADADIAHDVDARQIGRHNEHRGALIRRRIGIGHGHDDQERCVLRIR